MMDIALKDVSEIHLVYISLEFRSLIVCLFFFSLVIHGMKRRYVSLFESVITLCLVLMFSQIWLGSNVICYYKNDIQPWKWTSLLDIFNPTGSVPTASYMIKTRGELQELLTKPEFRKADRIQLVDVKLGKEDAPRALKMQAQLVSTVYQLCNFFHDSCMAWLICIFIISCHGLQIHQTSQGNAYKA